MVYYNPLYNWLVFHPYITQPTGVFTDHCSPHLFPQEISLSKSDQETGFHLTLWSVAPDTQIEVKFGTGGNEVYTNELKQGIYYEEIIPKLT